MKDADERAFCVEDGKMFKARTVEFIKSEWAHKISFADESNRGLLEHDFFDFGGSESHCGSDFKTLGGVKNGIRTAF